MCMMNWLKKLTLLRLLILVEKANFDDKLGNLKIKVTSNKTKHVDTKKKLTDRRKEVAQISENGYDSLLSRMYFSVDNV